MAMTTEPAQALFDLEMNIGINIDWQQLEALCAQAGTSMCRAIRNRSICENRSISELRKGNRAIFAHLRLDRDRDTLDNNSG